MKEKTLKRSAFLLFFGALLTAIHPLPLEAKRADSKRQTQKIIICPDAVVYQLQTPAGWNSGLSSQITLKFESSSTDGKVIYCEYDVNNAQYKNHATLTQAVPRGLRCGNDGAKSKRFTCEPGGSPIKIKPKSK